MIFASEGSLVAIHVIKHIKILCLPSNIQTINFACISGGNWFGSTLSSRSRFSSPPTLPCPVDDGRKHLEDSNIYALEDSKWLGEWSFGNWWGRVIDGWGSDQ